MNKTLKIILLVVLVLTPTVLYKYLQKEKEEEVSLSVVYREAGPKIALIFDDLGESLKELKDIYSLGIPLSISIIPGLRFSNNIAYIGERSGFSILIHLPLEPKEIDKYNTNKYKFISSKLSRKEIDALLRYYLNSIPLAIGVNNHMGSRTTEDRELMRTVLAKIKEKGLLFIDSRTSLKSVAYEIAKEKNMLCAYNEGFIDAGPEVEKAEAKIEGLVKLAKEKDKIIIIAHPKKSTVTALKKKLPELKKEVEFVTLKDYFGI